MGRDTEVDVCVCVCVRRQWREEGTPRVRGESCGLSRTPVEPSRSMHGAGAHADGLRRCFRNLAISHLRGIRNHSHHTLHIEDMHDDVGFSVTGRWRRSERREPPCVGGWTSMLPSPKSAFLHGYPMRQ